MCIARCLVEGAARRWKLREGAYRYAYPLAENQSHFDYIQVIRRMKIFIALACYIGALGLANAAADYPGKDFKISNNVTPSISPSVLTDWLNEAQSTVQQLGIQNQVGLPDPLLLPPPLAEPLP